MRRPLTPRERRGAALIALALVLGAGDWLLIDSWFAGPLRSMGEQAEQLREQQQRYAGVLRQGESLRQQLEQARQDPASSTSLLPGDDPSAVAADLMQRIADLINSRAGLGGGCRCSIASVLFGRSWRFIRRIIGCAVPRFHLGNSGRRCAFKPCSRWCSRTFR